MVVQARYRAHPVSLLFFFLLSSPVFCCLENGLVVEPRRGLAVLGLGEEGLISDVGLVSRETRVHERYFN